MSSRGLHGIFDGGEKGIAKRFTHQRLDVVDLA